MIFFIFIFIFLRKATEHKKEVSCKLTDFVFISFFLKSKTILGDHLTNVEINRDNVSEILQIYMEGHSEQKEVAMLAFSLRTKPFQAHSPSQKASVLAFLVNELCCSKAVIR